MVNEGTGKGETPPRKTTKINPEILQGIFLEGLDQIEVVVVKQKPFRSRVTEGVFIHLAGATVAGLVGIILGVLLR